MLVRLCHAGAREPGGDAVKDARFAASTVVAASKSKMEIEELLRKYGATEFSGGWINSQAAIQFVASGRRVRFIVPMPTDADVPKELTQDWRWSATKTTAWVAQEERRRWRCLLLAIKAKLTVVESGISTFEAEFLAHVVLPDGSGTIYDALTKHVDGRKLLPAVTS